MQITYLNTTTTGTTPASVINSDGRAIVIRKMFVGNPVVSGNITIFNENNALSNNTTQIVFKNTYPASFATFPPKLDWDFRTITGMGGSTEDDGIFCATGGSIAIDQTMQLTVFWDYAQG